MSRFGIRKKILALAGREKAPDIVRYSVTYLLPDGTEQTVEAEEHYTLLMASQALPSPISTGRRAGGTCPDGLCGLCRVTIVDSTGLTSLTDRESDVMDAHARGDEHEGRSREPGPPVTDTCRLGCHTKIIGSGARVKVAALVDFDALEGDMEGT